MAEARSKKLERLVRVQRQIERMAENDLALVLKERAAADISRENLVGALGSLDPVHRAMAGEYARSFANLEGRIRQLSGFQAVQEKRVLTERTKADRLAESAIKAAGMEAREAEDENLLDLIDAFAGRTVQGTSSA